MKDWSLAQRLAAFVTLPALALLALGWFWLDDRALFFKEGHTVELCSVLLLLQGVACWFAVHGRAGWREWQIPALLMLFAMRELDFDKRFTGSGLLKLRTYTGDGPLSTKVIGACVILFVLVVVLRILRRNLPAWWRDLRAGKFHAAVLLLAGVLTFTAKQLDGLGRKLLDFGITISSEAGTRAGHAEEVLELLSWWLVALAIAAVAAVPGRVAARDAGKPALAGH